LSCIAQNLNSLAK